jgi:hypothetical protein
MSEARDTEALEAAWRQFVALGNAQLPNKNHRVSRSPRVRVRILVYSAVLALPLLAIAYLPLHVAPSFLFPQDAPTAHLHETRPMPVDELSKIVVNEVKKRQGWSGAPASRVRETVGNRYFFIVERDPAEKKPVAFVRVTVDCDTGRILGYQTLP